MANKYELGYNPFQDYLFQLILNDIDISNKKIKSNIDSAFMNILEILLDNRNDITFLDFDIIKKNNSFTVIGKNAISAIWLSGIIPDDIDVILENDTFIIENIEYKFNKKTKKLTHTIIDDI